MSKLRISAQEGRALALALIALAVGCLLIPPFLAHISTNLLAIRATEEGLNEQYAADAGVEDALYRLAHGEPVGEPFNTPTLVNGMPVTVTVEDEGDYKKITSIAGGTIIVSYVEIVEGDSDGPSGSPVFGYAAAALGSDKECDIDFEGNLDVTSDPAGEGNVHANGNICLSGNAEIHGDATATGVITISRNAEVHGVITPSAPSLVAPEVDTESYKAEAEDVECAVCGDIACGDIACGDITHWGNWSPSSGDYEDPEHVQGNLNISGIGTFTFGDSVCVDQNLNISSITTVTFEGPVKVAGNLNISTMDPVTFKGLVCVEGDLVTSSEVIFEGGVKVGGKLDISGNDEVTFEDPVKVEGVLDIKGNTKVTFRNTACVGIDTNKNLNISGNADVTFESPVEVGGKLNISGNAKVTFGDTVEDTVCVKQDVKISGNSSVTFAGPIKAEADLKLEGNNDVPFGDTIYVGNDLKISGNKKVELGGTVYVCGDIKMSGNSDELVGGKAVIADGNIDLTGNSNFNEAAENLPFVVSKYGDIRTLGNSDVAAVIYALDGHAYLSGNSDVYGCVVALSVTGQGNNDIVYPIDLRERDDLPGGGDEGDEGGALEIRTYNINP